jgi:hypothetical protein
LSVVFITVPNDLTYLLVGLTLLWLPRSWLRLGKPTGTRKKLLNRDEEVKRQRQPSDHSLWIGDEFGHFRNWVDLTRGFAGAIAVAVFLGPMVDAIIAVEGASSSKLIFVLSAGIYFAAITIQMIRIEERMSLTPPIFFLFGMAFAILGPGVGLIAFIAIWSVNIALPNASVFLGVYATIIVALGTMLGSGRLNTVLMAALALFPPLVAVLFKRRLAQFKKRRKLVVR